jgi:methionyl-tRNA formyltransferase
MRLAVFGSPAFAIPTLHRLLEKHEVVLVVTQPDKPVGRGMKLTSPPLAEEAKRLGLRLEQPAKLKNNQAFHDLVKASNLDVAVTAAYGKMLPQRLLDTPHHGFLNVHASLLPNYRGAAPIQWALMKGDKETGISIMQTDIGLDSGAVRHVKRYVIQDHDHAITLFEKLAVLGAEAIDEALDLLEQNQLPSHPQNHAEATLAPLLSKEDGRIRWEDSGVLIFNRYRGVLAWPGSWTMFRQDVLKVIEMEQASQQGSPGRILELNKAGVIVGAFKGSVLLKTVQLPNKPKMSAIDWANGYQVKVGEVLGVSQSRAPYLHLHP